MKQSRDLKLVYGIHREKIKLEKGLKKFKILSKESMFKNMLSSKRKNVKFCKTTLGCCQRIV